MEQRHRPEVAEGVEGHQQRAGRNGRAQKRQGNLKERGPGAPPKDAGRLLKGRVQAAQGGADGQPGRNYVIRESGEAEQLTATAEVRLQTGDRFVVETPGGGGYGPAERQNETTSGEKTPPG